MHIMPKLVVKVKVKPFVCNHNTEGMSTQSVHAGDVGTTENGVGVVSPVAIVKSVATKRRKTPTKKQARAAVKEALGVMKN